MTGFVILLAVLILYLANTLNRERRFRSDVSKRVGRDSSILGVDLANCDLDVEPFLKLVLLRPDGAHLGQCVAFDHSVLF